MARQALSFGTSAVNDGDTLFDAFTKVEANFVELYSLVSSTDPEVSALAALTSAADALPYFTGSGTADTTTLTAFGRSLIDDANAAVARATLDLEPGTDVQAHSAVLDTLVGLSVADGNFIVGDGAAWVVESGATVRSSLGLGSMAVENTGSYLTAAGVAAAYQPLDADLTALAGLTSAADKVPYFTGSGTAAVQDFTAAGRSMVGAANAAAQTALLDAFTGDSGSGGVKGLVPAPASGDAAANRFLKSDGTWTAPAGSGDVSAASTFGTDNRIIRSDGTDKGVQSSALSIADTTGTIAGFADGASLNDDAGNEVVKFGKTASAVNEATITNAATGNAPVVSATGGDTNITLRLQGKGTGGAAVQGTSTNDDAPAGYVGELVSCFGSNAGSSTVTISNASPGVVSWTSHGLTAGSPVYFTTTGTLPTGLSPSTNYWVSTQSLTANSFCVSTTAANAMAGTSVNTSSSGSGTHTAVSGVIMANATGVNMGAVSLTAGEWDVFASIGFLPGASTSITAMQGGINTTSATIPNIATDIATSRFSFIVGSFTPGAARMGFTYGPARLKLSATTTVYGIIYAEFATSTMTGFGKVTARRVR